METIDIYLEKIIADAENAIYDGNYFEGKELLEKVLSYEPGYAKAHNLMGWMYLYYIEDEDQAERYLKFALKFDPTFKAPYIHLTTLYLRNEQYDRLEEVINHAQTLTGINKSMIAQRLGIVAEARGDYSLAIKHYKTAIFHSMDNHEIEEIKCNIKRCNLKRFRLNRFSFKLKRSIKNKMTG